MPTPEVFEFEITCPADKNPAHYLEGPDSVVVSKRFLESLREAGVRDFEVWPAILRDPKTGREWKDYFALNATALLEKKSIFSINWVIQFSGHYKSPDNHTSLDIPPWAVQLYACHWPYHLDHIAAFKARATQGKKMFRIPEIPTALFITDEVLEVLRKNTPPEKWGGIRLQKVKNRHTSGPDEEARAELKREMDGILPSP